MTTLSDLKPGSSAKLVQIGGERGFRRRLMELGFLPGTSVRMIRCVKVGDLIELEIRGCHLSIRRSEARKLWVEPAR
jgi:ferrous iron transport protein A